MTEATATLSDLTGGRPKAPAWPQLVVVAVAALTPIMAYLNSVGFAVFVGLAGMACLPLMFRPRRPLLGLAFLLALALWALASMQWSYHLQSIDLTRFSPEDLTGPKMLLEVGLYGAFVIAAASLAPEEADRAAMTLGVGMLFLALLFIAEGVGKARLYHWIRGAVGQATGPDYAIRDVGRVAYVLVLLFWPAAIHLADVRAGKVPVGLAAAAFIAVSAVAGASLLGADAPTAALAVSGAAFALVMFFGPRAVWLCLAATVLYFATAPLLVQVLVPAMDQPLHADAARQSWAIRLDIWQFAADRILEHPFMGWGLDASRVFSPDIQLHPHNGALQLWLELGAVGVALAATFWAWLFIRVIKLTEKDRVLGAMATATASVFLTIGALSFGVWQEWWLALGAIAAAACIAVDRARPASVPQGVEPGLDQPRVGA